MWVVVKIMVPFLGTLNHTEGSILGPAFVHKEFLELRRPFDRAIGAVLY